MKLAIERCIDRGETVPNEEAFVAMQMENMYIQRAENILNNITRYTRTIPSSRTLPKTSHGGGGGGGAGECHDSSPPHSIPLLHDSESSSLYQSGVMDTVDGMYVPFIFCRPMRLPTYRQLPSRKESATIIFNLALVDHLTNRASEQAVQLYELAMSLVTGEIVDELGVALMNNIGAWCYENSDLEGTLACIGHLSTFMGACSDLLNEEQKEGLQANVLWMSISSCVASPAA